MFPSREKEISLQALGSIVLSCEPSSTVWGVSFSCSSVLHAISYTDTHLYSLLVLEHVPNLLLGLWVGFGPLNLSIKKI